MQSFKSLSEQQVLALAISLEEEDARIYDDLAAKIQARYPAQAEEFRRIRQEEDGHRHRLLELYVKKFGQHIPLIRRQDVKGFVRRRPLWTVRALSLDAARRQVAVMELETRRFYETAARQATDAGIRQLLGDLVEEERKHQRIAEEMAERQPAADEVAARKREFLLQVVQPGLAGLMDGSISTLAPLFAAAFATKDSWDTFRIGLAASVGAGISMGFAEALSDDGSLTGRGRPWSRGLVCGGMTALGGLGHTMPYMIPEYLTATWIAMVVVAMELIAIAWVRNRFMETPWVSAVFQVVVGGALVFLAGILIGSS